MKQIFLVFFMFGFGISTAAASTLRVTCDDQATGAEISINDKYKGECPIDIQVNEGKHKLKAVKKIDGKDTVFKDEIRVGDGVTKRIEVSFGASSGAVAPAAAIKVDQNAIAKQRYEIEMVEYNKSIQSCLPKHDIELRKLKSAARKAFTQLYRECQEKFPSDGRDRRFLMCGSDRYEDGPTVRGEQTEEQDALENFETDSGIPISAKDWCQKQFTAPKAP